MESQQDGLVIDPVTGFYVRTAGNAIELAGQAVAHLYGRTHLSHIVSSGMNAIMLTFMSLKQHIFSQLQPPQEKESRPVVIMGDELYCDTDQHVVHWLSDAGFEVVRTDPSDYEMTLGFIELHKTRLVAVFFESCSNPSGKVTDWRVLKSIKEPTWIVIDNTWLSPVIVNPFLYGANVVLESGTKYLSGGQFIIGQITTCSSDHPSEKLITYHKRLLGIHVSPIYCRQLVIQLQSLPERVARAVHRAKDFLSLVDKRVEVCYSGTPDSKFASGIVLLKVQITNPKLKTSKWKSYVITAIESSGIKAETSYGKPYDSICNWVQRSRDKESIQLRLAFGYGREIIDVSTLFSNVECILQNI